MVERLPGASSMILPMRLMEFGQFGELLFISRERTTKRLKQLDQLRMGCTYGSD